MLTDSLDAVLILVFVFAFPLLSLSLFRKQKTPKNNLFAHVLRLVFVLSASSGLFSMVRRGDQICNGKKSGEWKRFDTVMLRHVDTKLYVSASSKFEYHVHPVEGQMEIYSTEKAGAHAHWKTNEGFYFTKHLTN